MSLSSEWPSTPDGKGYWLVNSGGGTYQFGDAGYFGGTVGRSLNEPIVGMASTSDGGGYWLVAADGGVFAYGNAVFYGSMGGQSLNKPIVGITLDEMTGGYWLVASDGGVFDFNAPFCFSVADLATAPLVTPFTGVVGLTSDAPNGYWLVSPNGAIWSVAACSTPYFGSQLGATLNAPVVGMARN